MVARARLAAAAVFLALAAVSATVVIWLIVPNEEQENVEVWEQAVTVEPGIDYLIVSNGHALTSDIVALNEAYSLAGVPVTTDGGVPAECVTPNMLWRFVLNDATQPGDAYYADDDMMITQSGAPVARDIWRGENYMRFCVAQPEELAYPPEHTSWQIIQRGDVFYLSAVSGSEDTNNLLYYSKYYGAFTYLQNYPDMTQRLFSIKLFRRATDEAVEVKAVSLMLEPPEAGRPALGAYTSADTVGYRVESIDWTGEPAVFASETEYAATIAVKACGGYRFAPDVAVTVNGVLVKAAAGDRLLSVRVAYPATGKADPPDTDERADPATLLVTSDMHEETDNLRRFLELLRAMGEYPRTVSFAGDMYTGGGGYFYKGWYKYAVKVSEIIKWVFPASEPVYTMGNHDWESLYDESFYDGEGSTCFPAIYGCARVGAVYPGGDTSSPYVVFNLGATDVTYGEYYSMFRESDLEKLRRFLELSDSSGRLIVINSHWPLHYAFNSSHREVKNAELVIDLLNEYADRNGILFVWGHNHNGDPAMLTARGAGDTITCDRDGIITRKLRFTYANAGAMMYGTGLLVRFDERNLYLTYYSLPAGISDALDARGSYKFSRVG
jgi:hypothetical protein